MITCINCGFKPIYCVRTKSVINQSPVAHATEIVLSFRSLTRGFYRVALPMLWQWTRAFRYTLQLELSRACGIAKQRWCTEYGYRTWDEVESVVEVAFMVLASRPESCCLIVPYQLPDSVTRMPAQ